VRPTHVPKRVERSLGVDFFGENDGGAALCTTPRKAVGRKTQQCRYRKYRTSRRERIEGGFTQFKACKAVPSRVSEEPSVSKRLSWREAGAKGHEHQPRWGVWVFWEIFVCGSGSQPACRIRICTRNAQTRLRNLIRIRIFPRKPTHPILVGARDPSHPPLSNLSALTRSVLQRPLMGPLYTL